MMESRPADELVGLASESGAGVLVLGGPLSGGALRAVTGAAELRSELAVLVVGPLEPRLDVLVAVASGVHGYVPSDSTPEAIADAAEALIAGELVLPRVAALPLATHLHSGGRGITVEHADRRLVELTRREWEVLVLLKQAYSTAAIADRLAVSKVTVRTHVAALVRKLGVPDRAALTLNGSSTPWRHDDIDGARRPTATPVDAAWLSGA
jgi:DNA-binding NarL/FixJ family response regulator